MALESWARTGKAGAGHDNSVQDGESRLTQRDGGADPSAAKPRGVREGVSWLVGVLRYEDRSGANCTITRNFNTVTSY